jgi:hypothetical protein
MRGKYQTEYFRVKAIYVDGEFSGRVFKDRESAEKYAARQKRSPVVKKAKIEPFTRNQYTSGTKRERNGRTKPMNRKSGSYCSLSAPSARGLTSRSSTSSYMTNMKLP